ncbi:hypothetical protein UPYG_G00163070 [Umbra pygmaea]|uniref:RHD domain-containing protein n=1 Tax=Umbra pygmaea TaxID=75934 RepID=A0ABD0WRP9_UMBPY
MTSIYEEKEPHSLDLVEGLGPDNGQEELDFSYLFLYNPPDDDLRGNKDNSGAAPHYEEPNPPSRTPYPCDDSASCAFSTSRHSVYHHPSLPNGPAGHVYSSPDLDSRPDGATFPSPRIEITPSGDPHHSQPLDASIRSNDLAVPGYENATYRDPPCLSPASSNSSTGWLSSPCVSPSGGEGAMGLDPDFLPGLQGVHTYSPHSSPGASPRTSITEETFLVPQSQRSSSPHGHPRARSPSPQGKRTYDQYSSPSLGAPNQQHERSRSPSPTPLHCQAGAQGSAHQPEVLYSLSLGLSSSLPRDLPSKMVRPSVEDYREKQGGSCVYPLEPGRRGRTGADTFYILPTSVWPAPPQLGGFSSEISIPSLPPLEVSLPSHYDPYALCLEQQPKQHHRAHYETEGSRGAVKAPGGGHTVVQLHGYRGHAPLALLVFIGTADERVLKPHAFYQVHRITGKTVTTPSQERMVNGTKVLEIPLEPKNNMRAVIDCAGILKLRNADIELRTGETDIGRKNTCVRLVFRVHIPEPDGQYVSLQVASLPIECSQRSAHELPTVERQDVDFCSLLGGQQMILTGQNFTSDSKVVFTEKTAEGLQIWESEATVDRGKSQSNMLFVEIPPYRDHTIYHPAKVNFYVINGRRKRSQMQHFTYTPLPVPDIKTEPVDDFHCGQLVYNVSEILGVSPNFYHHAPNSHLNPNANIGSGLTSMASCQRGSHQDLTYQPYEASVYHPIKSRSLGSSPVFFDDMTHQQYHHHHGGPLSQRSYGGTQHHSALASHNFHASHSPTNQRGVNAAVPLVQKQPCTMDGGYGPGSSWKIVATQEACFSEDQGLRRTAMPILVRAPPPQSPGHSHGHVQRNAAHVGLQREPVTGNVTVKQENLSQAYLDDVNDIIRNDLTSHSKEQ